MTASQRRVARGSYQAEHLRHVLARELRDARISAGLSQRTVGRAVGISGTHVARLERSSVPGASVELYARLFAVLGMRLSARPYPEGPPLRDAAHARLLTRFRRRLAPALRLRTEVPLRRDGDLRAWDGELRAWDGELTAASGTCKLEAETALHDLQATDRRIALKMAADGVERVILLVADTRRNRRVLREFHELVGARYPLRTRAVMVGLRAGRLPRANGVVVL
jgi:transcriptional regulator with XRE-family HTH domain